MSFRFLQITDTDGSALAIPTPRLREQRTRNKLRRNMVATRSARPERRPFFQLALMKPTQAMWTCCRKLRCLFSNPFMILTLSCPSLRKSYPAARWERGVSWLHITQLRCCVYDCFCSNVRIGIDWIACDWRPIGKYASTFSWTCLFSVKQLASIPKTESSSSHDNAPWGVWKLANIPILEVYLSHKPLFADSLYRWTQTLNWIWFVQEWIF